MNYNILKMLLNKKGHPIGEAFIVHSFTNNVSALHAYDEMNCWISSPVSNHDRAASYLLKQVT